MIERTYTPYAVINVDIQNDFCPGGSLAVNGGNLVIQPMNEVNLVARRSGAEVIFTRDWHPAVTSHFAKDGGTWPDHCVQNTPGAEFPATLDVDYQTDQILSKGMKQGENAFSGFDAINDHGLILDQILKAKGVQRLLVGGLATDYCVKATVLDGLKHGYEVMVIENAVKAVNLNPGDEERAWEEMVAAGAIKINSNIAVRELLSMDAYLAGQLGKQEWKLRSNGELDRGDV